MMEASVPISSGETPAAAVSVGPITGIAWLRKELVACISTVTPSASSQEGRRRPGLGSVTTGRR